MAAEISPGSRHPIPIRKPNFPFDDQIPKHWAAGNPLASHVFNAAQLTFPEGERFFIKAVKDALPKVDDPELVKQARGFAGQEAVHGKEHERFFDTLRAQGYEIDRFLTRFGRFIRWSNGLPLSMRVAMTAALEHYTATFGYFALADKRIDTFHPTVRALIIWHATEEVEHKAVAYDVMQAAGIGYVMRIFAFLFATLTFFGWVITGTRMLLRQDGLGREEVKGFHRELREDVDVELMREVGRRVLAYFRPGFHPNDADDLALAHGRLREVGLAVSPR